MANITATYHSAHCQKPHEPPPQSITPQHTLDQIPKWPPKLPLRLSTSLLPLLPVPSQSKLLHKKTEMLEPRIQMRLQPQLHHHGIVMTVHVRVDAVEALEHCADGALEFRREGRADAGGEEGLVVDVGLAPG